MNCAQARTLFSPYLDGAVTGREMHAVSGHLNTCAVCSREYSLLIESQSLLNSLGRKKAPADLALRLRVAISQEAAAVRQPLFQGLRVRLENALDAFMVPATAGAAAAVIVFGLLMGSLAIPAQLEASRADVPLPTLLHTPPELQSSGFGLGVGSISADSVVVEAYVDAKGRVEDYRIISGPRDEENFLPQLNNALIFTVFRPATALGRPTTGRAVLSFSKINVKG